MKMAFGAAAIACIALVAILAANAPSTNDDARVAANDGSTARSCDPSKPIPWRVRASSPPAVRR